MMAYNLCYCTLVPHEDARKLNLPPESLNKTPSGEIFVKPELQKGILPEILEELLTARKRAKADLKVFEFQKGTLQNLYWKTDGCSSCSGQSSFACVDQNCAIKASSCKGKGGQVDCSTGIQLAFSGTDKHDSVLNSW